MKDKEYLKLWRCARAIRKKYKMTHVDLVDGSFYPIAISKEYSDETNIIRYFVYQFNKHHSFKITVEYFVC